MWQEINYTENPIDLLVPNITYKINPAEIESIEANSIAEEIGFESGDSIISITGVNLWAFYLLKYVIRSFLKHDLD